MKWFEILVILFVIFLCIIIMALVESYYELQEVRTTSYNIMLKDIKKNEKIAFIADFHSMKRKLFRKKIISAIKDNGCQSVIIGGDMIIGKGDASNDNAIALMEELCSNFKVYFTYGNHESRMFERNIEDKSGFFEKIYKMPNLTLVNDRFVDLNIAGKEVGLFGITLSDEYYNKRTPRKLQVSDIIERYPDSNIGDKYSIIVCHKPDYFKVCADAGFDLVLSGHNHGGIIRLPRVGGVISTSYKLFPEYSSGKYYYKDKIMILTAGLGVHTIPFRLFNKPEVVILNFTSPMVKKVK